MPTFFALPRLVCPETRQPLTQADPQLIEQVNAAVAQGQLKFASGEPATERVDGGFVRSDGLVLYPVIRGIPHLTTDQAISVAQLNLGG